MSDRCPAGGLVEAAQNHPSDLPSDRWDVWCTACGLIATAGPGDDARQVAAEVANQHRAGPETPS